MKEIAIENYNYDLPTNKIAMHPLPQRDASRLVIYKNDSITESTYRNISDYIPNNSLMVFNQSRVMEARVVFTKPSGGRIEIFCLEPHSDEGGIGKGLSSKGPVKWVCLIGGASKWKHGQVLEKQLDTTAGKVNLRATWSGKVNEAFIVTFSWEQPISFADVLHTAGTTPLPPYIKREADTADAERYQTIYANQPGSVAAPTAGLHFTDHIMSCLDSKSVSKEFVTLHVGAGTFKPVKAAVMADHEMHAEFIDVSVNTLKTFVGHLDKLITAVGTTSVRTIESLYWIGVRILTDPLACRESLALSQWFAAEHGEVSITPGDALGALINWLEENNAERIVTSTQLLIAPGYRFRIADALVTNFHQPGSTLILLVAAMAGENWRSIYNYALQNDFRFLSYGDGCLIFRHDAAL